MDEDLEVTEAVVADLAEVRSLLAEANEGFRAVLPPAAFEPYVAMVLDLEGRLGAGTVLVLRADGRAVGTATFFPDARDEGWGGPDGVAGLRAMAVDPSRRRQGVGETLVAECVRRARSVGARALTLHTAAWLPDAIRLYERCGFARARDLDRRASELMGVPEDADYVALGYRLDLDPSVP